MVGRYVTLDERFYKIVGITDKKVKLQRLKVKKDGSPGRQLMALLVWRQSSLIISVTLHTERIVMYDGNFDHIKKLLDERYIGLQLLAIKPKVPKMKRLPRAKKTAPKTKTKKVVKTKAKKAAK